MKIEVKIMLLFVFFIFGCSTTYRLSSFSSKEKYYEKINSELRDKEIAVELTDEDFPLFYKDVAIQGDTLFSIVEDVRDTLLTFPKKEITEIYFDINHTSANVYFKNGQVLKAESVKGAIDSVWIKEKVVTQKKIFISEASNIKTLAYKNKGKGAMLGIPLGIVLGGVTGILIGKISPMNKTEYKNSEHGKTEGDQYLNNFATGVFIGVLTGLVTGHIVGYPITYEFDK